MRGKGATAILRDAAKWPLLRMTFSSIIVAGCASRTIQFPDTPSPSRGALRPSDAKSLALKTEGVGNAGCPLHPRPRVRILVVSMHTSIHSEFTGITRHPHAMVLRLIPRSPLRSGFLASVASRSDPQSLTPASRRQDHTTFAVRLSAARQEHIGVHRIPPRVRDDREPPLRWDGTAIICEVIWVGREQKYFCKRGWTDQIRLIRFNKSRFQNSGPPPSDQAIGPTPTARTNAPETDSASPDDKLRFFS
jgi:hypothetical protein